MSLENLYKNASSNTYVGMVKAKQEESAPTSNGVNFLDGATRGPYDSRATAPADQYQTEFKRNDRQAAEFSVLGGAQGIPRSETSAPLTRWTDKAFKIAFDGEGPNTLSRGYYTSQYRPEYQDIDGLTKRVHQYIPPNNGNSDGTFYGKNGSARNRINTSPSGAPTRV